jgi:hypothetical protein
MGCQHRILFYERCLALALAFAPFFPMYVLMLVVVLLVHNWNAIPFYLSPHTLIKMAAF